MNKKYKYVIKKKKNIYIDKILHHYGQCEPRIRWDYKQEAIHHYQRKWIEKKKG